MAVPFNVPEEPNDASAMPASGSTSAVNSTPSTPSHHQIHIPQPNAQQPHISAVHNEALVQAFYEALVRCSQGKKLIKNCDHEKFYRKIASDGEMLKKKNLWVGGILKSVRRKILNINGWWNIKKIVEK